MDPDDIFAGDTEERGDRRLKTVLRCRFLQEQHPALPYKRQNYIYILRPLHGVKTCQT